MRSKKILVTVGYIGFTLVCLFCSFYLTFPAEAAAGRIAQELQRSTHGVWSMTYDDVSAWRFSGLAFAKVRFKRSSPANEPMTVSLDAVRARVRLVPLLLARTSVRAQIENLGGSLDVLFTPKKNDAFSAHMEVDNFDLAQPPALGNLAGMPVGGKASGVADINWESDLHQAAGNVDLKVVKLKVGPGSVSGFTLPGVDLGDLNIVAEIHDAKFKVTQFKQKGGSVSFSGRAASQLKNPMLTSSLDACVWFRADPKFLQSNPKVRDALTLAEVRLKKDAEGYLQLPLGGMLGAPQLTGGMCH